MGKTLEEVYHTLCNKWDGDVAGEVVKEILEAEAKGRTVQNYEAFAHQILKRKRAAAQRHGFVTKRGAATVALTLKSSERGSQLGRAVAREQLRKTHPGAIKRAL